MPRLPYWARFDMQSSLQRLRSHGPLVVKQERRKLHLRWRRAKEPKTICPAQDGLGRDATQHDKTICDTCRKCRAWEAPGKSTLPWPSLPGRFNKEVECDLFFNKRNHAVFHIIDRCIRRAEGKGGSGKERDTLLDTYYSIWHSRWKRPQALYCDG